MNAKEFVTRIIKTNQNQIFQRVRSLPKLLPIGLISILGLLTLASIPSRGISAYAQQVQLAATDPWYQSLDIARSKVQAALSPGAIGHGVPGLQNLSTTEILMAIGIPIIGAILAFVAVRMWLSGSRKKAKGIMAYQ